LSSKHTFYFYDLETSGFNPRTARVMQFGGQRTGLDLKPVGKPHNFYIKLTDDVLPDPEAVLVTGITPQKTKAEGLTEAEFLKIFQDEIAVPGTIFTGFNIVRFDDEFMRFMHYRNFYDPYEWQWKDGRGKWELLDVVRMTRALRPEGIKWGFNSEGKPSNTLGLLTTVNKLAHENMHDALSDVNASIAVAKLVKSKQPKLFEYLLNMRDKSKVEQLVKSGEPFVYTSGKYPSELEKTTVVTMLADHPKKPAVLVYDLRHDPAPYLKMKPEELAQAWQWQEDPDALRLPVKTLQFNRCPAVAPLGVLSEGDSQNRLKLDMGQIKANRKKVQNQEFVGNLLKAFEILDKQQQTRFLEDEQLIDSQLYDGFFGRADQNTMRAVRAAKPSEILDLEPKLHDPRLKALLPLYQARNYPTSLTVAQTKWWQNYCAQRLSKLLGDYFNRIEYLSSQSNLTQQQKNLLDELKKYGQNLATKY
jgi:exodeoxyribonuclease-1